MLYIRLFPHRRSAWQDSWPVTTRREGHAISEYMAHVHLHSEEQGTRVELGFRVQAQQNHGNFVLGKQRLFLGSPSLHPNPTMHVAQLLIPGRLWVFPVQKALETWLKG